LPNAYCQKCHAGAPPAWLTPAPRNPYAGSTKFWNQSPLPDKNLHNVHVNKVWASYAYHYSTDGDLNKVRCNQCHSVHPTATGRNFLSSRLSAFTGTYSGNWSAKTGCSVAAGCHTCNWCHAAPGGPATACWSCYYHSYSPHSGIAY
jgi:hypothetical protein